MLLAEQRLGDLLDVTILNLTLVHLHDVADQSATLLDVGDAEGGHALFDQRLHHCSVNHGHLITRVRP